MVVRQFEVAYFARSFKRPTNLVAPSAWAERPATVGIFLVASPFEQICPLKQALEDPNRSTGADGRL